MTTTLPADSRLPADTERPGEPGPATAGETGDSGTTLVERLGSALATEVAAGRCSASWAYCLLDIAAEAVELHARTDLHVAHLLHRSVRAEASKDGPPVSRIATMRAPELRITPPAGLRQVPLPTDPPEALADLYEIVTARRSTPMFGPGALTLEELAGVLQASFAMKGTERGYQRRDIPKRVAASAGGLQSYDAQVLVNKVEGLDPGRYAYDPVAHALNLLEPGDFRSPLLEATIESGWTVHAQAVLALTGDFPRVSWKYGTRGYRYMGLDAGVVTAHVYLAATVLDLSVNAIAAFADDRLNALLRLDGQDQFAQLLITLGRRPGRS